MTHVLPDRFLTCECAVTNLVHPSIEDDCFILVGGYVRFKTSPPCLRVAMHACVLVSLVSFVRAFVSVFDCRSYLSLTVV